MTEMSQGTSSWQEAYRSPLVSALKVLDDILIGAKAYTVDAVEHLILAFLVYSLICVLLYTAIVRWKVLVFRSDVEQPKRVLLVTAHPDDECMFFGPTVLSLSQLKNCSVYILCLSAGKNYGMNKVRKKELYESCRVLGIKDECIMIREHDLLPDAMNAKWPVEIIEKMIVRHVEAYGITAVITFDKYGVSRHANHRHLYYAVAELALRRKIPPGCDIYVLESVNIIRKYWFLLDIPLCYLLSTNRYILNSTDHKVLIHAMYQHKSQLLWFRKLYMIFSRYSFVNTLRKLDISDLELELVLDDE